MHFRFPLNSCSDTNYRMIWICENQFFQGTVRPCPTFSVLKWQRSRIHWDFTTCSEWNYSFKQPVVAPFFKEKKIGIRFPPWASTLCRWQGPRQTGSGSWRFRPILIWSCSPDKDHSSLQPRALQTCCDSFLLLLLLLPCSPSVRSG